MMNIKYILAFYTFLILLLSGCKETNGYNEVISSDMSKPDVVSNIKVDNFNGGSFITYDLPTSENVLYVLAKYKINDKVVRESKASYYTDTIAVDGFSKEQEYEVTLYTVSRANVFSDPLTVKVNPKKPVYTLVQPTIQMEPDFGGINITATNTEKKEIGLIFLAYDENTGLMEVQDQYFTKESRINYSVRGYESKERLFGVYVTDKFGNISDTLKSNITPLYEELLDKSKFSLYTLASDSPIDFGWLAPYLWDGSPNGNGWHTRFGELPPYVVSFSIGKEYKLSRLVMWQRLGEYTYGHGNPKDFSLWGSNVSQPRDAKLPVLAEEGTVIDDWVNLGNFHFPPPPSGLPPGQTNSADEAFVRNGINFNISISVPPVKYVRVAVANTWSNGTAAHIMEISLYGTPQ